MNNYRKEIVVLLKKLPKTATEDEKRVVVTEYWNNHFKGSNGDKVVKGYMYCDGYDHLTWPTPIWGMPN